MRLVVALACIMIALPAMAQQYKWVDADGRVQYTDNPPPGVKAEPIKGHLSTIPSAAAGSSSAAPARSIAEQEQAFRKRQVKAQEDAKKQEVASQQTEERQKACENARARIAGLESGRQVRFDANGERHFLDDSEIAQESAQAQQDASKYCR